MSRQANPTALENIGVEFFETKDTQIKGWLYKRNKQKLNLVKPWLFRYVVVYKGVLYYFKNMNSSLPKGSFQLTDYNRIVYAPDEHTNMYPFLMIGDPGVRTYCFAVRTEDEMFRWITQLQKAIVRWNSRSNKPSNLITDTSAIDGDLTPTIKELASDEDDHSDPEEEHRSQRSHSEPSISTHRPWFDNKVMYLEFSGSDDSCDSSGSDEDTENCVDYSSCRVYPTRVTTCEVTPPPTTAGETETNPAFISKVRSLSSPSERYPTKILAPKPYQDDGTDGGIRVKGAFKPLPPLPPEGTNTRKLRTQEESCPETDKSNQFYENLIGLNQCRLIYTNIPRHGSRDLVAEMSPPQGPRQITPLTTDPPNPNIPHPNISPPNISPPNTPPPNIPRPNTPRSNIPRPNILPPNIPPQNIPHPQRPQIPNNPPPNIPRPNISPPNFPPPNIPPPNIPPPNIQKLHTSPRGSESIQPEISTSNIPCPRIPPPHIPATAPFPQRPQLCRDPETNASNISPPDISCRNTVPSIVLVQQDNESDARANPPTGVVLETRRSLAQENAYCCDSKAEIFLPPSAVFDTSDHDHVMRKLEFHNVNGMYAIRRTEKKTKTCSQVLMVWWNEACVKYRIQTNTQEKTYTLDPWTVKFNSLLHLIEFYRLHNLPEKSSLPQKKNLRLSVPFKN